MRIEYETLKQQIKNIFVKHSLSVNQAEIVSDCFVMATACGVSTHGISMLPAHIKKLDETAYNIKPSVSVLKKTGAFAVLDSDNAIGPYSAKLCMDMAIDNAKQQGIYTVFTRNSNTYGPAFYYTYQAVQQDMIGITFCNTPSAMAPWGGTKQLLGTNPFAIGIPSKTRTPLLFDMASSIVAKSKINRARLNDETIPEGWAINSYGHPTTDPIEAIKGCILPMAEHKGSGIAMAIDIISGVLSGAAYLDKVNRFYSASGACMNVGQVFIGIDPIIVYSDDFFDVIDDYLNQIIESPPLPGNDAVRYPGQRKIERYKDALINGVDITFDEEQMLKRFLKE